MSAVIRRASPATRSCSSWAAIGSTGYNPSASSAGRPMWNWPRGSPDKRRPRAGGGRLLSSATSRATPACAGATCPSNQCSTKPMKACRHSAISARLASAKMAKRHITRLTVACTMLWTIRSPT
jgi:hypothetical protein